MKKTTLSALVMLCAVAFAPLSANAQISHGGAPSFNHSTDKAAAPTVVLPTIDNQALLQEDIDMAKQASPLRISKAHHVSLNNTDNGKTTMLADGSTVWRLNVTSPGALHIALYFNRFELPEGAEMYIYDESGDFVLGRFLAEDTLEGGIFYTQEIPGSVCRIEYHEPAAVAGQGRLEISEVYHGYKDFFHTDMLGLSKDPHGSSDGNCHINVICSEGDDWRDQIRSVVCISMTSGNYGYLCSGALINNTNKDKTPYVLSASHCQEDMTISRWVFYFNYQTSTCTGNTGTSNQSLTGATIKANYAATYGSDFLLLQLSRNVPNSYKAYYAGWDRTNSSSISSGCGIHHPGGAYKKISIPRSIAQGTSGGYTRFWTTYWYSGSANKGVTEGGSSGSPLFNSNGLIVGQLYAGSSSCNYNNTNQPGGSDMYGRMFNSWTGGGSSTTRLRDWLDPAGTNVASLQGINYDYDPSGIDAATSGDPDITVYPNPSRGILNLNINEVGRAYYHVYDAMGRCVLEGQTLLTTTAQQVNISSLPAGAYRLQVDVNGRTFGTTVVKQ